MKVPKIPQYQDAKQRVLNPIHSETPMDEFIYHCSPDDFSAQSTFRYLLQRAIDVYDNHYYFNEQSYNSLTEFLRNHESDIANGVGDFGSLMGAFIEQFNRLPQEE